MARERVNHRYVKREYQPGMAKAWRIKSRRGTGHRISGLTAFRKILQGFESSVFECGRVTW